MKLSELPFDNTFARLHPAFYQVVDPTPLAGARLVAANPDAARLLDLDPAAFTDPDAPSYLSGGKRLPGAEPVAMRYAGHQFGVFVPELGDGRAILLGEVVNSRGERWDLHLKGAGQTRFSRMGDGRAVLRSTIREYLASEAMHGLGIPTTRALSIVGSDDMAYRETVEPAAALIRLAPTHVRFGTFQVFAARNETNRVRELADYVIDIHEADLRDAPDRHLRWFTRVVDRTADLLARWMAVGFAHGVMNTDNMSVLGLTLDYGPFGWMDGYDPGFVCNHSDHEGRYAFDRQPAIALWNLARFGEALLSLLSVEEATGALDAFAPRFNERFAELMRKKLGLRTANPADLELLGDWLSLLGAARADYSRAFRALALVPCGGAEPPPELARVVGDSDRLHDWVARYGSRLATEGMADGERRTAMERVNPKYVLRNYLAQQAIERAERGDYTEIERLRLVLTRPFDEQPELERYADPPPAWARELVVSCSS
jgi:uncharacterized protein YdiU (UPF0061 family)